MKALRNLFLLLLLLFASCSPLKTSPNDEKHQLELTLHEVQTSLDDLRHDINCFQTELQILDGRIKYYENTISSLKHHDLENQQSRIEKLSFAVEELEKKWGALEKSSDEGKQERKELSSHAEETSMALSQFRDRITEIEKDLFCHSKKFLEVAKTKEHIETLVSGYWGKYQMYKVKAGDSLEKIAKRFSTDVDTIKSLNQLKHDLIVIGQELKVPLRS